jgi:hypothetical protein
MPATEAELGPWAPWAARGPSALADHGAECCATARTWFHAMSRSLWRGQGGPTWIRRRWEWGPTCWPLHWCEAMAAKELCCGAQAALSIEAFRGRGVDALPVQLVQRYEAHNLPHWHSRWSGGGANPAWAADAAGAAHVYHEACALVDDGAVRVWNPTAAAWLPPEQVEGYAGVVAIRVGGAVPDGRTAAWGPHRLALGEWHAAGEGGAHGAAPDPAAATA